MQNKNVVNIVLVILVILGVSYIFFNKNNSNNYLSNTASSTTNTSTTPTTTTKNTGTPATNITNSVRINQRVPYNGIYITPIKVSYDGRCPIDVKCTQSSSFFDLGVTLESNGTTQSAIISLNKPFAFSGKVVTLTSVTPARNTKKTLAPSDYRFFFKVN